MMSPLVLPPPMLALTVMSPLVLPVPMLVAKSAPVKTKVKKCLIPEEKSAPVKTKVNKCLIPEEKSAYRISRLDFVQLKKRLLALKQQRGE
jgi:hypothetical protein